MKRHLTFLVLGLALAAGKSVAREPQAPPSPAGDGSSTNTGSVKAVPHPSGYGSTNIFVGHYGETIELRHEWIVKAELRGLTEVVYLHRKYRDDKRDELFHPKPGDYTPENFARLELIELVVVPKKSPGGLRSLQELRRAKEIEITQKGLESEIVEVDQENVWPRGTFYVITTKPYRLLQTYSESPNEFYILTTGDELAAGDFGFSKERADQYNFAGERAGISLGRHLLSLREHTLGERISWPSLDAFIPLPAESGDLLRSFKTVRFIAIFGTIGAAMMVMAFWPGATPRSQTVRLFGRSIFIYSHLLALIGFISIYAPIRLAGVMWKCSDDATVLPVVAIPIFSWITAQRLGSGRSVRVAIWTGALSLIWITAWILTRDPVHPLTASTEIVGDTAFLYLLGILSGCVFFAALGPSVGKAGTR